MLWDLLLSRRRYRPDWRDRRFLEAVEAKSIPFAAYRRDHPDLEPAEIIAGFFRNRESPRFFADPEHLRAIALQVRRERPAWVERTLERVRRQRERGLGLYARTGPPLTRAFPWRGLEPGPGGDKLYRKRPHRFAFAPGLALAGLYGEPTDAALGGLLAEWMAVASSRDNGLAYDSNLGVVQRILALSWSWAFLAARVTPTVEQLELEALVLKVIRSDIDFLLPRLGDSFANNHLLADGFAGWFIGSVWPELAPGDELVERFGPLWQRELSRQILADGTSFEHSTHYHEYACEMASTYVILSRRNGQVVPDWVVDRTRRMLELQAVLAGPEGTTVAIGDAAEDPLFPLDSGDGWGTAAWREIHRALFGSRIQSSPDHAPSKERAFWLLGGALTDEASETESPSLISYPCGGLFVFHDAHTHSRLVFRTGPSEKEAVSAGHAHSDLLSVFLSARGQAFLVDAGTYTYRSGGSGWPANEPDWRRYLRGSAAHNGLSIDGLDALGEVKGDFRPASLATFVSQEKIHDAPNLSWVHARVVGSGVYASHRRGVVQIRDEYFVVYDLLPAAKPEPRRDFGFQFSPDVEVGPFGGRGVEVGNGRATLALVASSNLAEPILLKGSRDPLGGWVSKRYGELLPAAQARFAVSPEAAAAAFLLLTSGSPKSESEIEIEVREVGALGVRIQVSLGEVEDTLLLNFGSIDDELLAGDMAFKGDLVWVRSRNGVPSALRWLNGARFEWSARGILVRRSEPSPSLQIDSERGALSVRLCDPATVSIQWRP